MSFADIAGGAACGPSNPLQNLGKRFGQDRSTQFDRFGGGNASSSTGPRSSAFRTSSNTGHSQQDGFHQSAPFNHGSALDLAPLSRALPLGHDNTHLAPNVGPSRADFEASFRQPLAGPSVQGGSPWSGDFMNAGSSSSRSMTPQHAPARMDSPQLQNQAVATQSSTAYRNPHFQSNFRSQVQPHFSPMNGMQQMRGMTQQQGQGLQHAQAASDETWNDAFTAFDTPTQQEAIAQVVQEAQKQHPEMTPFEADELAATAGRLVSTVEHDQNDKFKQSSFLNLMRKLRDREAGVQGTDIVENTDGMNTNTGPRLDKGKGRVLDGSGAGVQHLGPPRTEREAYERMRQRRGDDAVMQMPLGSQINTQKAEAEGRDWLNELWAEEDSRSAAIEEKARQENAARQAFLGDGGDVESRQREDDLEAREFQRFQNLNTGVLGAQSRLQTDWEEDMDEASKEDFVGRRWEGTRGRGVPGAQAAEWDKLQADWDAFEAGPSGLRASSHEREHVNPQQPFAAANIPRYQFQENNPYLQTTRNHSMHASPAADISMEIRSILESEAAVQQDPTDSQAWFNLGVKQQENEREMSAIAALHRAIQINPLMKEAWLALAVSYTNENNRTATFESIQRWIEANDKYAHVNGIKQPFAKGDTHIERHGKLVSALLAMARHGSTTGEVDADVQVALGILFNASDEFSKAVDCFSAAISVRPNDWLLYNRLGAVLSNSGRSEDALNYYRYALELKPDFARCHFNLAISCLNLQMHAEAAKHCFIALSLQAADEAARTSGGFSEPSLGGSEQAASRSDNYSLWETLRVSLELQGKSSLADMTRQRDVSLFDISDFEGGAPGPGDDAQHEAAWFAMEPSE